MDFDQYNRFLRRAYEQTKTSQRRGFIPSLIAGGLGIAAGYAQEFLTYGLEKRHIVQVENDLYRFTASGIEVTSALPSEIVDVLVALSRLPKGPGTIIGAGSEDLLRELRIPREELNQRIESAGKAGLLDNISAQAEHPRYVLTPRGEDELMRRHSGGIVINQINIGGNAHRSPIQQGGHNSYQGSTTDRTGDE